ncbi:hypothetical protein [Streptomyces poonensis]|uniref:hypothetical protein n=1 Tax=Streptomyces poonensis TaxID=68255 RepID=UPI001675E61B|nr:hypothetical protein [Streptomyces poonensis]
MVVGEVLASVDLQDDAPVGGHQQQEVHADVLLRAFAALVDRLVVPVQPHLGQQGRQIIGFVLVDVVVQPVQVVLPR